MAFTNRYSNLTRPDVLLTEYRFHIHYMEKGLRKLKKNFDRIKSYGSFEPLLVLGATRPPPQQVSIQHPLYGKGHPQSRKILIAIQRSDQKLWLVRTVTRAWRDQTSSSTSIDSTSTIWKRASGNSCKILIAMQ